MRPCCLQPCLPNGGQFGFEGITKIDGARATPQMEQEPYGNVNVKT